jgi:hypothetical protein
MTRSVVSCAEMPATCELHVRPTSVRVRYVSENFL